MTRRAGGRAPLAVRIYAWLLVRLVDLGESSDEATHVFGEMYLDARRRGRLAAARVVSGSIARLALASAAEWKENRGTTARRGDWMSGVAFDLRYSLRALARRPGFALPVVLILAAGIGATTTIYSAVDTVVLRELPYPEAGRLVFFEDGDHSYPSFRGWQELPAFEAIAAVRGDQVDLVGDGAPQRLRVGYVSQEFFPMLGAAPELGRFFAAGEYREETEVVVLSDALWRRVWGASPDVVGRTIRVDGRPRTVVGIVAREFRTPSAVTPMPVDLWMPLGDGGARGTDHGFHVLSVSARLAPGVSLEAAQTQMDEQRAVVAQSYRRYVREDGSLATVPLLPLKEASVRRIRPILLTSLGAVALLLLIACANVANLFLARGTTRMRETMLRQALGAGRARVVRQVLGEAALLALLGGALGVGLAYGGVAAFQRFAPAGIPGMDRVAVDVRILASTLLLSVGTALLFGLLPAVQAARSSLGDALREGAAAVTGSRAARRARSGLVAVQIALALVLTTSAGLLFRSFVGILQVEPGFQVEGLTVLSLELNDQYGEEQRVAFTEQLLERVRRLPGVLDASAGVTLPFTRTGGSRCCWSTRVQGATPIDEESSSRFFIQPIADGYFTALGARMVAGREFKAQDGVDGPPVAILNASAALELFGVEDAVGRTISFDDRPLTVIGVEDDLHHWGLSQPAENNVYVPYRSLGGPFAMLNVAVRSEVPLETLASTLREAVWEIEPNLPIGGVQTMAQQVSGSLAAPRFLAFLFGAFAGVSLLLACSGIYSSMLYAVGQRTREMGIRYAVGASGREIVAMVLRSGLGVVVLGTVGGLAGSAAVSKVIGALLWNVPATDPLTYAAAAALLALTALLASLVPALKAARTDPLGALRSE